MRADEAIYEVYALRYGSRVGNKAKAFHMFDRYAEPDEPYRTDYFFWLARNAHRTVLIDCGYNKARADEKGRFRNNDVHNDPLDVLMRLNVRPEDVDEVILTHIHYDHVGNVDRFPNARFSIGRAEFEFWTGSLGRRELLSYAVDDDEVELIKKLQCDDRLRLLEDNEEAAPGIQVTRCDGHTPGQLVTDIQGRCGPIALASDAAHFYEEFEADRPFSLFSDLPGMYRTYEFLRQRNASPGVAVVPGHDPAVMHRFKTVKPDCVDLAQPVD